MKTKLIFQDGRSVSAGVAGENAVMQLRLTQSVNAGTELTLGSCCAAMAELKLMAPSLTVTAGEEFTLWRGDVQVGVFITQKPVRSGPVLSLTAYDRVCLLDKDITGWLQEQSWPCRLYDLAVGVSAYCGAVLMNEAIPNGDFMVERFVGALTGRQLMQWIGSLCGCFCRADAQGRLVLDWYSPAPYTVTAGGTHYYFANSLQLQDYQVKPIEKVQLCQTGTDVGVVWPNVTGMCNTYRIQGNPLLSLTVTEKAESVAQSLYQRLSAVCYTPCQVCVPESHGIQPGMIIQVQGQTVYVMTTRTEGGRTTVECTGSADRMSGAAVNQFSYKALTGRVLELSTQVEGLTAENRDQGGDLARLKLTVEGLSTTVSQQSGSNQQRLTSLEQTAQELAITVQKQASQVTTSTGYTFGAEGLRINKSGTEIDNCLDHTGMYVRRAGQTILQASAQGVHARDVQVENYLNIGTHARFEDYAGRTACFYIEGGNS